MWFWLVLKISACMWEMRIFYQLANIDLVLKDRVCEIFEIKFHYFIATSYYMQTKVEMTVTFYNTEHKV